MGRSTLTRDQARRFYDRTGERQVTQLVYERPALERLVRNAAFGEAGSVVELGCGPGHFARELLTEHLPREATSAPRWSASPGGGQPGRLPSTDSSSPIARLNEG